ncbi:1-(5-phosphoribosyl)-5-[(5-phosphoribosylamino)methylideneamino]imidazole-4-carboxamide isomerase [soil metagenome]
MELIPAIDLRGGRVVRLLHGDFARSTDYGADPIAVARAWESEGASRLHLVDLDGAREGFPAQADLLRRIVESVGIPCQVAGGLRTAAAVQAALGTGADRVVLGTALLADPGLGRRLVGIHGRERIVAGLDVRGQDAVGDAWGSGAATRPLWEVLVALVDAGVGTFVVTAITRDGALSGPDLALLQDVRTAARNADLIASGGVATLDDVRALAAEQYAGAILGRALYEGRFTLGEALAAAAS